jgi:hypothetical protein
LTYHPEGWPRAGTGPVHRSEIRHLLDDIDGHRELLVSDPDNSCNQPIPLAPRPRPHQRPSTVDYRRDTGTYYMQDVYAGMALAGVQRGTVRRLRVVALEYRAAGIGQLFGRGPGGQGHPSTPIAVGNGSWDVKVVLGDAEVHADGSAFFEVPARTPVYFQALDERGYAVQTMRSWSTLAAGREVLLRGLPRSQEHVASGARRPSLAMKAGVQPLGPSTARRAGSAFPTRSSRSSTATASPAITTAHRLKDANHAASPPAAVRTDCGRSACWASSTTILMPSGCGAMPI